MAATTAASPLQDNGEFGVRGRDVDDLLDGIPGAWFEGNVLDPESLDILIGNFYRRDTGANCEPLNRHAIRSQLSN